MCCDDNSLTFVLQILTGNKAGLVESIPLWTSSSSWTCQVFSPAIAHVKWAKLLENLSSGFPSKRVSSQSPQLQRLARKLKFHL